MLSPPFEGTDLDDTLQKVQRGEFPSPRTIWPEVAPALEAICLKAMALRPGERYLTAQALADDLRVNGVANGLSRDGHTTAYYESLPDSHGN
jgi:hypothetical protein